MWRIWFFFGILKISFAAPVETSQEDIIPTSEIAVLKCLLSSPLNTCEDAKRSVEKIPKRIQKLYEKLKKPLLNATGNEVVDATALDTLPASLLYLIPKFRLTSMTGFTASEIVRRFPFDDALTMKILSLFTDKTNIKNFLNGLADKEEMLLVNDDEIIEEESIRGIAPISPAVEKEIAHALSRWFSKGSQWEYWLYKASMITGTPVLASLPNYFLNSLSLETTEKFLFHLRNWRWDNSEFFDPSWSQHSMSVKRIWSSIVLNKAEPASRWTPKILRQFGFFLIGATPDELSMLSNDLRISHDFKLLLDLNWNTLQARTVFDVGYHGMHELTENDLHNAKNLISHLLPRQIQQFSHNATDFSYLRLNSGISLPTEKQLFSHCLAHLMSKDKTSSISPSFWKEHMPRAGKFYHIIPPSSFEPIQNETIDLETLMKSDSSFLSFRHTRYLTNSGKVIDLAKPETVLKFKGLLKAVPSLKLVELSSNVIPHTVKEHLLMFTSGESLPFTASVLEKVRKDLTQTSYLEKMLYNRDFRQYFNLLGNRDITQKFKDVTSNLLDVVGRNPVIERNVRSLPANTLSALLSVHRREAIDKDGGWNYENLIESPLKLYISGLTCADIEVLEISDFMPVIGYYVHQRRAMNEIFPKNMQYCSQKALTRYFKLKASLRGLSNEPFGLLNLLELHEVRAVGGYILAGLPINIIDTLGIKYQIISEIGKLTIPELLTATSLDNVKKFAEIYVRHTDNLNLQMMTGLGNLLWFLNEGKIENLNVTDFKLHVESLEENQVKALCLDSKERNAWNKFLIRAFGKPDSWSSGTLSYLGDLLFVFDEYELERINRTSRTEAADVLAKSSSFYTVLEWPGKPKSIYIYEACLEILPIPEKISYRAAVKQIHRFYLESVQYLLDTVSSFDSILQLNEEPNLVENALSLSSPVISTKVDGHFPGSVNIPVPIHPSKILDENLEDYEYSKEGGDDEKYGEDAVNREIHDPVVQKQKSTNYSSEETRAVTEEVTTIETVTESEESESDEYQSDTTESHTNDDDLFRTLTKIVQDVSKLVKMKSKRFTGNDGESKSLGEQDFLTSNTKSFEELKEELHRNASRALIIEVPLNRSDFVNFGSTSARHMKITCDAIKILGKSSSLILDVQDFEKMDDTELEDCAEYLGTLSLDSNVKNYIWGRLTKWKENGNLLEVGSLVSAIDENDITKIPLKLNESWALENLHVLSTHITDTDLMLFIIDQFLLKNLNLNALNYETAVSLGPLLCTMTLSHQRKYLLSRPDVFVNLVKSLGRSLDCGKIIFETCIRQLASIATSPNTFGETHSWNANDVSDLGVIVAGLKKSDWQSSNGKGLKAEALAGLSPSAVSCIPPDVFKVLTEKQLSKIPTLSAAAISLEQSSSLSPSQYEIIDRVRRQVPPDDLTMSFGSGSPALGSSARVSLTISVTVFVTRTFFYL